MLLAMLLMLQTGEVVLRTSEPRPASPWRETFLATCGRDTLAVTRPLRPLQSRAEVLLNGRRPGGDLRALEDELSDNVAAYRMSFTCDRDDASIQMRWVSGQAGPSGQVRYRAGSAVFQDGSLVRSQAEDAMEEAFWYR